MKYLPLNPDKTPAAKGWNRPDYPGVGKPEEGQWVGLRADDLVIIDCDSDEAYLGWVTAVGSLGGTAETYTVKTPRGFHLYYRWTPGSPTGPAVGVLSHVDLRAGAGSYVVASVAPGYSVHLDVPLAPFNPAWLPRSEKSTEGNGDGWETIPEGQRNSTLAAMAGTLRAKGASVKAIAETVYAFNKAKCDPPLDDDEVALIARSISRYEAEDTYEMEWEGEDKRKGDTGWWGDELESYEAPPLTWVVDGLIPEGLTILAGKPKIGKSWFSLGVAVEVARGGDYLGLRCSKGRSLYLALEDTGGRLKRRMNLLLPEGGFPEGLRLETVWAKAPDGLKAIHEWMSVHPDTKLVIVDTLAKVRHEASDRQKGSYADDYKALEGLKAIADRYNIAVIVVHHLRKGAADDVLDEVSGTTGLAGAADTILVLKQERLEGRGRDIEEDVAWDVAFDEQTLRWQHLGDADFECVWSLSDWLLERGKPGDKVPSERLLREAGIWSQDELRRQLVELRDDPRFIATQPQNPRSPLVIAPRAAGALDA